MYYFFYLLDWLAFPVYIFISIFILWHIGRFLKVRKELSSSYFELERDLARNRQGNILTAIIIAVELLILLCGVQLRAIPYLETEHNIDLEGRQNLEIAQDMPFVTDTAAPALAGLDLQIGTPLGENFDTVVLTPTLTPSPIGTIIPNAPPIEGCADNRAYLQIPTNGMRIFQPILVRGTAYSEEFSQAKLEIRGPSTNGQYVVLSTISQPITDISDFSQFVPAFEEGEYEFRLMVFDLTAQPVAFCKVTIYINTPLYASTPLDN
jgi:hypothetical protein